MSIHPSLSSSAKAKKIRSVLKRAERLKILMEKDEWKEGHSIFALPKIKTIRLKIKKEKAAPAATAAGTEVEGEAPPIEATAKEAKPTSATEKSTKSSSR
jgi:small basic protein (TIGR04137 family)